MAPAKRLPVVLVGGAQTGLLKSQSALIAALAGLDKVHLSIVDARAAKQADSIALAVGSLEVHIPLAGMVDLDEQRTRLEKELAETETQITRLEKLSGGDFTGKAPAAVAPKERERLQAFRETAEKLKAQLG